MLMRDDHEMDLTDADLVEQERIAAAARRYFLEPAVAVGDGNPMWRNHTCWKCREGTKVCPQGGSHRCGYPVAKNH
jgi:hypothetical protein